MAVLMSVAEIVKQFGPAGVMGGVLGVALVTWIQPETAAGASFLVTFSAALAVVGHLSARTLGGLRRRKAVPPPEDAAPEDAVPEDAAP